MPADDIKKDELKETNTASEKDNSEQQPLHVHNPFTGEEKEITQAELDSIEQFKEAQTERD